MITPLRIKNQEIGPGSPVFIIAEMSGNHNQSLDKAMKLIDVAADAGVDAIKLQTYRPDTLTIDCDNEYFQVKVNDAWKGNTLYHLYQKAYTPWDWQPKLKKYAESKGVMLFSTPFDETAVDFLESMMVDFYKVASFEIGHIPLLKKIGNTRKPVIVSRGLSSAEEIDLALKTLREAGAPSIAVLHCVSSYPALPEQMNLTTIPHLKNKFEVVPGISDHTLGLTVPIAAVALGAKIVEKHYTLSRKDGGPDAAFSLEPEELKAMVKAIRETEKSLGKPTYTIGEKEKENLVFKQSIFVVENTKKGEIFTSKNIKIIRPGYGMEPKYYEKVLGRISKKDIARGTPLNKDLIDNL